MSVEGRPEWDIELIRLGLSRTLRVRHSGVLIGYCASVLELERLPLTYGLTIADLVELDDD